MPRTQGKPIEWSPPSISGRAPLEATCATPRRDLVEALFQIGRDGEHVAGVAQRHLLAQVDAELVVVGRVEGRDPPDALRPEPGARAVGGAAVERDAEHGRVVLADVAHVLDIGRLEERVDAGEMGQLAAREGRDRAVGQALGSPAGPCRAPIAAPCASPPPTACPRPRSPSSPGCRASRSWDGDARRPPGSELGVRRPAARRSWRWPMAVAPRSSCSP